MNQIQWKVKLSKTYRTSYESDEEDYNQPIRTDNAFSSNYIEYGSNGDEDKKLSITDYLDKIRPYLNNLIDGHRSQGEWKVQLKMSINFFSFQRFWRDLYSVQS